MMYKLPYTHTRNFMQLPYVISIDVTNKCNLRCLHCFNCSGEENMHRDEMSDEEVFKCIVDSAYLYPHTICICGGEPLLRKEVVFQAVKYLKQKGNNTTINMVTNGTLLDESIAKEIIDIGLSLVQVSLDGSSAAQHDWLRGKEGSFEKAVNALRLLNGARKTNKKHLGISVACTPNRKNISTIIDTINLCEELEVDLFRMQPLMLLGRAERYLRPYVPTENEYRELKNILLQRRDQNKLQNKMTIEWEDPIDHLFIKEIEKYPFLSIGAYGDLLLSPYIPISFGNIKRHSLSEYINNNIFKVWNTPYVHSITDKMITPEKLDVSSEMGLPKLSYGLLDFDVLSQEGKSNLENNFN